MSLWFMVPITSYNLYNYSIHGVYKPSYNWGAPHFRSFLEMENSYQESKELKHGDGSVSNKNEEQ